MFWLAASLMLVRSAYAAGAADLPAAVEASFSLMAAPAAAPYSHRTDVPLKDLLNRQRYAAHVIEGGPTKIYLSIQIDANDDNEAYVVVATSTEVTPWCRHLDRHLDPESFSVDRSTFELSLDKSMWRKKVENLVVIDKLGAGNVYKRTIEDLLAATLLAGQEIDLGGKKYRLFYSSYIDTSKSPPQIAPNALGVWLVYFKAKEKDKDSEYKPFNFPVGELAKSAPVEKKLFKDQKVRLRLSDDLSTLEIGW